MTVKLTELQPGTELELSYDGSRGARTITVYVVDYDRSPSVVEEWEEDDIELRLGDTDAGRFLRLGFDVPEDVDEWDYEDSYTNVRSLNSKAKHGRRLGKILDLNVLDSVDDRGQPVYDYRNATTGDVVQVDDREGVVTDDSYGLRVEFPNGDTETLRTTARRGVYYNDEDYNSVEVEFSRTGETVEPSDEDADLFEVLQDYGHGQVRGKVVGVEFDGTRYELTYRHDADEEGIRLTGPDSLRDGDVRLRLDPLGLTFSGDRISVEDLTLVYGEETDEDEESEFDTLDARETEVVEPTDLFSDHELTGTYVGTDGTRYVVEDRARFRPFLVLVPEDKENAPEDAPTGTITPGYFEERLRSGEFTPLSTDVDEGEEEVETDGGQSREVRTDGGTDGTPTRMEMLVAVEESDAHADLRAYVEKAYERGGTGVLDSMATFVENRQGNENGVDVWRGYGSNLEKCLYDGGAEAVLNHELPGISLDVTNREILEEIQFEKGVGESTTLRLHSNRTPVEVSIRVGENGHLTEDERADLHDRLHDTVASAEEWDEDVEFRTDPGPETVEVDGKEVPEPLAGFYQDDLRGLFAVRPGSGRDGVILYDSCKRVGGRAAVEIANDEPQINDESDYPGVSPPRCTFGELVGEYGLAYEVIGPNTYVYVPEEGR